MDDAAALMVLLGLLVLVPLVLTAVVAVALNVPWISRRLQQEAERWAGLGS